MRIEITTENFFNAMTLVDNQNINLWFDAKEMKKFEPIGNVSDKQNHDEPGNFSMSGHDILRYIREGIANDYKKDHPGYHFPSEYIFISAHGRILGSFTDYIKNEQRQASVECAPINAVHKDHDGKWVTIDDMQNQEYVKQLKETAEWLTS